MRCQGTADDTPRHSTLPSTAVAKNAEAAHQKLIDETRQMIQDLLQREATVRLEECRRLEEHEIAKAMAQVASDCVAQVPLCGSVSVSVFARPPHPVQRLAA